MQDKFSFIWDLKVPNKVIYHVWRALMNRLPTRDNLFKRGDINDQQELLCPLGHGS